MKNYDLGKTLKTLRQNFGYSQKEMSKKTFFSPSTISRFENNTQSPTSDELIIYLDTINVSTKDFFTKVIDLDDETKNLNANFQKILIHYQEEKNSKLHLINDELIYFTKLFDLQEQNIFNTLLPVGMYIELHNLYPTYFKKMDEDFINKSAEHILLKKKIWLNRDFSFLATTIHNLYPNNIVLLCEKIIEVDIANLSVIDRRYFETILENLTDNLITNRKSYLKLRIKVKDLLKATFDYWNKYTDSYRTIENLFIKDHNYTLYELVFNLKDKKNLIDIANHRYELMKELGINYMADAFNSELKTYENDLETKTNYLLTR